MPEKVRRLMTRSARLKAWFGRERYRGRNAPPENASDVNASQGLRNDATTRPVSEKLTKDVRAEALPGISHLDQGIKYIKNKEYDRAISELSEAVRSDPKAAEAYHQRGMCHLRKGEFDPAVTDFSTAIKLGNEQSYAARGEAFYHKGRDTKAIADIDMALQLDPKDHHAYQVKALVMSRKGDHRSALTLLQSAQSIHPSSEYQIGIGQACEHLNDGYNAIASYSRAIRLDPESAIAYGHRAWQFVRLQMYGPAIADYDIGLSIERMLGSSRVVGWRSSRPVTLQPLSRLTTERSRPTLVMLSLTSIGVGRIG